MIVGVSAVLNRTVVYVDSESQGLYSGVLLRLALYSPGRSYSIYVGKWVTRLSQLPSSSQLFVDFLAKLGELFT